MKHKHQCLIQGVKIKIKSWTGTILKNEIIIIIRRQGNFFRNMNEEVKAFYGLYTFQEEDRDTD